MNRKRLNVIRISGIVVGVALGVWLLLNVVSLLFEKTLWDALKVLAVPLTVGAGVPLLNWLQKKRELDVENQRAQDEALQAYLDQMSQLLTDKQQPLHGVRLGGHLSALARARSLTMLPRLDGVRKGIVLRFLYESDLISKGRSVVSLAQAGFGGTYLSDQCIYWNARDIHWWSTGPDFSRVRDALTRSVYLNRIDLSNAELSRVNLSGAYLDLANLTESILSSAYLADVPASNCESATSKSSPLRRLT